MMFYTLVDLVCLPMLMLIVIVSSVEQIKNSDFFQPQSYTNEEKAVEKRFGKLVGKFYHWFI